MFFFLLLSLIGKWESIVSALVFPLNFLLLKDTDIVTEIEIVAHSVFTEVKSDLL